MPIIPFRTLGQLIGNTLYFNTEPERNDRFWNTEGDVPSGTRFISDGENLSPEVANRPLVALATDINDLDWVILREYALQAEHDFISSGTSGSTDPIILPSERILVQVGDAGGGGGANPRDTFYIVDAQTGQIAKNNDGTEVYVTSVERVSDATNLLTQRSDLWEGADQSASLALLQADLNKVSIVSQTNITEFGRDYISVAPSTPFGSVEPGDVVEIYDVSPKTGKENNDGVYAVRAKIDNSTLQLIPFYRAHNPIVFSSSTNGPLPLPSADPSIELNELSPAGSGVFGHCRVWYNAKFLRDIQVYTNVDLQAGEYIIKYGVSAQLPAAADAFLSQGFRERGAEFGTQSYSGTMQDVIERLIWNPDETNRQWDSWSVTEVQSLYSVNTNLRDISLQGGYDHDSYGAGNTNQKGSGRKIEADAGPVEITVNPSWGSGGMTGVYVDSDVNGTASFVARVGSSAAVRNAGAIFMSPSSGYSMETRAGTDIIEVTTGSSLAWVRQRSDTGDGICGPNPMLISIAYSTSTTNADAGLYYIESVNDSASPKELTVRALDASAPSFSGEVFAGNILSAAVSNLWYTDTNTYAGVTVDLATSHLSNSAGVNIVVDRTNLYADPFVISSNTYSVFGTRNLAKMLSANSQGHLSVGGVTELYESYDTERHSILYVGNSEQQTQTDPLTFVRVTMGEVTDPGNWSGFVMEFPRNFVYGGNPSPPFDGMSLRTQWYSDAPALYADYHLTLEAISNRVEEQTGSAKFLNLIENGPWSNPTDPLGSDYYIELFSYHSGVRGLYRVSNVVDDVTLELEDVYTGVPANFGGSLLSCRGRLYARDCVLRASVNDSPYEIDYVHLKVPSQLALNGRDARGINIHVYDPSTDGVGINLYGTDLKNTTDLCRGSLLYVTADYAGGGIGAAVVFEDQPTTDIETLLKIKESSGSSLTNEILERTSNGNYVKMVRSSVDQVSFRSVNSSYAAVESRYYFPRRSDQGTEFSLLSLGASQGTFGIGNLFGFSAYLTVYGDTSTEAGNIEAGPDTVNVRFATIGNEEGPRRSAVPSGSDDLPLTDSGIYPFWGGVRSQIERAVPIPTIGYDNIGTHTRVWGQGSSLTALTLSGSGVGDYLRMPILANSGDMIAGLRFSGWHGSGADTMYYSLLRYYPYMSVGFDDDLGFTNNDIVKPVWVRSGTATNTMSYTFVSTSVHPLEVALPHIVLGSGRISCWVPPLYTFTVSLGVASNQFVFRFSAVAILDQYAAATGVLQNIDTLVNNTYLEDGIIPHVVTDTYYPQLNIPFLGDYLTITGGDYQGSYPIVGAGIVNDGGVDYLDITVLSTGLSVTAVPVTYPTAGLIMSLLNPCAYTQLEVQSTCPDPYNARVYPGVCLTRVYNDVGAGGYPASISTTPWPRPILP